VTAVEDGTAVDARGLAKRFGAVTALDGVDLKVARGGVHGLLGPNGAGKTTFLRMLFRLVRPDAGTLEAVDGVAGFVESPRFYPYLTAERNLALLAEYAGNIALPATGAPTWSQWYHDSQVLEGKSTGDLDTPVGKYPSCSDVPSANAINHPEYPTFDTDIPDQYRADIWLRHFRGSEKTGKLADFTMLTLPQDHTNGTSGVDPCPTAMVADNDLAVGRVVDTVSHSRFWKDSAVFVLEDDSQNGTDHVDGHRAPLWIASPYAKRGAVVSTYYTQVNVVKTIEQILGAQPMNQVDRAAEPMYDAFTDKPDLTPFGVLPNEIPLDYGLKASASNAAAKSLASSARRPSVPAHYQEIARQWETWSAQQKTNGSKPEEDRTNPAQLNRIDWYASTGWTRPYPGDSRILGPNEVPGKDDPPQELN
jgi:energy-coupling factor transporter ATP-binding protein EcfA2